VNTIGSLVNFRYFYLILAIAGLAVLLLPSSILAQEGKDGLVLNSVPGTFNSEIIPGESKNFYIEAINDSSRPTTSIHFTYDAPKKWLVGFKSLDIATLSPGSHQTVEMNVTAPRNTERGDYTVTIIADSSVGQRAISIYMRVNQGTNLWMWLGIALGVVVIGAFVFVFRHFSKD
jgi:uncharacterized membrane protein